MPVNRYEFFFDLTRLEIQLWAAVDQALRAECGVTLGRIEAMLVLRRLGPCRIQEISRELVISVGGASKLIDRIEADGYCVRSPDANDRRSSLITLTAASEPFLRQAEATIDATLDNALGDALAAGELADLGRRLRHLRLHTAESHPSPRSATEPVDPAGGTTANTAPRNDVAEKETP